MKLILAALFPLIGASAFADDVQFSKQVAEITRTTAAQIQRYPFRLRFVNFKRGCFDTNKKAGLNRITVKELLADPKVGECAYLAGVDLSHQRLPEAVLRGANLRGADLRGTDFRGAALSDHADLAFANLAGARLNGAWLTHALMNWVDFTGANLTGAHFENADLNQAHFVETNSTNAHFERSWLIGADFSGANLTGAFLNDAQLPSARLSNCLRIEGVHWKGARYGDWTEFPFSWDKAKSLGMEHWPVGQLPKTKR